MTFEEILLTVFAKEFNDGLFGLADKNDGKGIVIDYWKVPNVPQPTHDEVIAMDTPELERVYAISNAFLLASKYIDNLLDTTAQSKQYGSAVACASYATSTDTQWKSEAGVFIAWRDQVFIYSITVQNEVISGERPIPTLEEFITGLPQIVWP